MIWKYHISYDTALDHIQKRRFIQPNVGFLKQLSQYHPHTPSWRRSSAGYQERFLNDFELRNIRVAQRPCLKGVDGVDPGQTGCTIWDSSIVLGSYLIQSREVARDDLTAHAVIATPISFLKLDLPTRTCSRSKQALRGLNVNMYIEEKQENGQLRVLEIGSGTGFAGLCFAKSGKASVVLLSDLAPVQEILKVGQYIPSSLFSHHEPNSSSMMFRAGEYQEESRSLYQREVLRWSMRLVMD